jgi:leader peptidase (prepilin peptidase) / N-methyltransferase
MEIILVIMAGWLLAGGINYLSDVLPESRSLAGAQCPYCRRKYAARDYLFVLPCKGCSAKRSARAWVLQIAFPLVLAALWLFPPGRLGFWVGSGLLAYFMLVAVIDLEHRLILYPVSWFGAVIGLAIGLGRNPALETAAGGAAGFGIMLGFYYLGILFNKIVSRLRNQEIDEVALGFGDVSLGGIIGLMLGWPEIIGSLLAAILLGGLVSGLIMLTMALLRRYKAMTAIPYAPFLLIGAIIFLYIPKS